MEEKEYYYLNGETKVGPLTLDALKNALVTASTLVWNSSLSDWTAAGALPELQDVFAGQTAPPTPPPVKAAPAYNQGNTYGNAGVPPPMPENYLIWAVLATVFCCIPLGIVAIINSTKVSSLYVAGDYEGARKASADAKKWATLTAIISGVIYVIFGVVYFFVIAAALGGY
jgi:hypothetical protein